MLPRRPELRPGDSSRAHAALERDLGSGLRCPRQPPASRGTGARALLAGLSP